VSKAREQLQVLSLLALPVQKYSLYLVQKCLESKVKAAREQLQGLQKKKTQFTCYTSTKVLALLVQKYLESAAREQLQVLTLLALLVQKYKYGHARRGACADVWRMAYGVWRMANDYCGWHPCWRGARVTKPLCLQH
jgi:hypothetical protein